MGTYKLMISTIMTGLSQDNVTDPILKDISEEEVGVLLNEILKANGITETFIPDTKIVWLRLKVMEQIYWKLALASAPLYAITIDGLSVKKESRFQHYMKLIEAIGKTIATMEAGDPTLGGATIKTYDTYTDKPYNHNSYITAQKIPAIEVIFDSTDGVNSNLSLDLRQCRSTFLKYEVYCNDTQIIDEYNDCSINKTATLVKDERNIHNNKVRVPITTGHVACVVTLKSGLKTYHELVLGGEN